MRVPRKIQKMIKELQSMIDDLILSGKINKTAVHIKTLVI